MERTQTGPLSSGEGSASSGSQRELTCHPGGTQQGQRGRSDDFNQEDFLSAESCVGFQQVGTVGKRVWAKIILSDNQGPPLYMLASQLLLSPFLRDTWSANYLISFRGSDCHLSPWLNSSQRCWGPNELLSSNLPGPSPSGWFPRLPSLLSAAQTKRMMTPWNFNSKIEQTSGECLGKWGLH